MIKSRVIILENYRILGSLKILKIFQTFKKCINLYRRKKKKKNEVNSFSRHTFEIYNLLTFEYLGQK
jgi:hypothetical protein